MRADLLGIGILETTAAFPTSVLTRESQVR